MIFPPVFEFSSVAVAEPAVPNKERIVLRPTEPINLGRFGIFIGIQGQDGYVQPVPNLFFWFGTVEVQPPCWLLVFTGAGEFRRIEDPATKQPVFCFHWGLAQTIFNFREVVPVVFSMGAVSFGHSLSDLPKLPAPPQTQTQAIPNTT